MKKGKNCFVHGKAVVEGGVEIGDNSSVWPGAVLRGDEGKIIIGKNCSVQDNCVVHGRVNAGDNVTIGHGAIVHGCRIGNNVIVGMNSTILSGAEIGDWVIIAAGTVVKENQKIPSGVLAAGVPAKIKRSLTEEGKARITESWKMYARKLK